MTKKRRDALTAIFPNTNPRALQAKLSKIRAAESKANGNSKKVEVIGSYIGNPVGEKGGLENNGVIKWSFKWILGARSVGH